MKESNSGFTRLEDTTRGSQVVLTRRRRYSRRVTPSSRHVVNEQNHSRKFRLIGLCG